MSRRFQGRSRANGSPHPGAFGQSSAGGNALSSGLSGSAGSSLSYIGEPPDLSGVSDPNVVVSLKNVLKKDSTTKTRALDDLVAYAQARSTSPSSTPTQQTGTGDSNVIDEALLEAWVQTYPRTSIDNSRRVRELSHTLLLELMKAAKKRMERHIPRVVGPWLAGTFDKDKGVARVATDGLLSFLKTEEKVLQFWKKCQPQILQFAIEAALETPDTLSDERSTNQDDSEAKYHRVLGESISLVLALLQRLEPADAESCRENYDKFFSLEPIWNAATVADSFVRRQYYQLLSKCLEKQGDILQRHLKGISKVLLSDALTTAQTGSATDLVRLLTKLTKKHPEIWGTKKSPFSRLKPFLLKGSHGSSAASDFWEALHQLFEALKVESINPSAATDLLKSIKAGITHRDEPRANGVKAWEAFLLITHRVLSILQPQESRKTLLDELVYPLIDDYIEPPGGKSVPIGGPALQLSVATRTAAAFSAKPDDGHTAEMWDRIAERLADWLRASVQQGPDDFDAAQRSVAAAGARFFSLVSHVHNGDAKFRTESAPDLVEPAAVKTLACALDVWKKDTYRAFGAASILETAIRRCPFLFRDKDNAILTGLLPEKSLVQMETLFCSPSASSIISAIVAVDGIPEQAEWFRRTWDVVMEALLGLQDSILIDQRVKPLLEVASTTAQSRAHANLQRFLQRTCIACTRAATQQLDLFETCFTFGVLTPEVTKAVVSVILEGLNDAESEVAVNLALRALSIVAHRTPSALTEDTDLHLSLVARLLSLSEVPSGKFAGEATLISKLLTETHADGGPPLVAIIQEHLEMAGPLALEVDTLVEQATKMASTPGVSVEALFPSTNTWMQQLNTFLVEGLNPCLSLTSELGGVYFLGQAGKRQPNSQPQPDRKGLSVPARMALYTNKLLSSGFDITSLPSEFQVELLFLLSVCAEAVSDELMLAENYKPTQLWRTWDRTDALAEAEEFVSSTRNTINDTARSSESWKNNPGSDDSLSGRLVVLLMREARQLSPLAIYSAKSLSGLLQTLTDTFGFHAAQENWIAGLDIMKATPTSFLPSVAVITGFGEVLTSSKHYTNLLNRLVGDIRDAEVGSAKSLVTLILFNCCTSIYEVRVPAELPVANHRLVFAIKQIISWFDGTDEVSPELATEACRALQRLMPCISEVYGTYWEDALNICEKIWSRVQGQGVPEAVRLPQLHASLKLFGTLKSVENDDCQAAFDEHAETTSIHLIELLEAQQDATSQCAEIVNALLCRQVEGVKVYHIGEPSNIYGLLASSSRNIQTAAFNLLHRAISKLEEQAAVERILDKTEARLPEELLSLLLDPPTLERYTDDLLATFPTPVRAYLLTWRVIFDRFDSVSFETRKSYAENIKESNYIDPLLTFIFDVLGHSAGRPLNLDKNSFAEAEMITKYDLRLADSEPDERAMQWFLIHTYYLTLKFLPGLVKSWYIDCRSKQTRIAVEAWTTSYFTPIVVSETLDEVARWAAQEAEAAADKEDEKELVVKTSKPSREVVASYEVDDQQGSIAIRLPSNFPLDPVTVVSLNRVAVSENKWQGWLKATQGIITFPGGQGAIVDGLFVFRRNLVGALKGQTECAICYAIISSDKRLPDKRCGTCKNLFHRECLYKWFQTSNQNSCPLCRNPIDYLGAQQARRRAPDPWAL